MTKHSLLFVVALLAIALSACEEGRAPLGPTPHTSVVTSTPIGDFNGLATLRGCQGSLLGSFDAQHEASGFSPTGFPANFPCANLGNQKVGESMNARIFLGGTGHGVMSYTYGFWDGSGSHTESFNTLDWVNSGDGEFDFTTITTEQEFGANPAFIIYKHVSGRMSVQGETVTGSFDVIWSDPVLGNESVATWDF